MAKVWLRDGEVVKLAEVAEKSEDGEMSEAVEARPETKAQITARVTHVIRPRNNVKGRQVSTVTASNQESLFTWQTPWPPEVGSFVVVTIEPLKDVL